LNLELRHPFEFEVARVRPSEILTVGDADNPSLGQIAHAIIRLAEKVASGTKIAHEFDTRLD
jgi:hypothetical protein